MLTTSAVILIKTLQNSFFHTMRRRKLITSLGHHFQMSSRVYLLYEQWQKVTPHLHRDNLDMNEYSSENWEDFVIIHIPQLNMTQVENNYTNLLIKEIKSTYF